MSATESPASCRALSAMRPSGIASVIFERYPVTGDNAAGSCGGIVVAIYRLLANSAFDPSKVTVMVEAYECACRALDLSGNRTDRLTELVAKKILEIAQGEAEPDAKSICERSLEELGIARQ